jgi:calcineurin-like phosphoesterase family protein
VTSRPLLTVIASLAAATLLSTTIAAPADAMRTAVPETSGSAPSLPTTTHRVPGVAGDVVEVVAVGDMVCKPGSEVTTTTCRHARTAALTKRIDPDAVLTLGDQQYETGSLFAFRHAYADSWGALRGITYPVPGNHEYRTPRASGYYTYFDKRQPGRPGYYTTNLGRWRVYALNTNCAEVSCKRQAEWLVRDLAAHPRACSLMTSHHPRYSSGEHGGEGLMHRFYRIALRHDVDLVLSGHDHHYERFARMNNKGKVTRRGVMQFVSGAGGKVHYSASGDGAGSAYTDDNTYGVLRLILRKGSFDFSFRGIDGSTADEGTRSCI